MPRLHDTENPRDLSELCKNGQATQAVTNAGAGPYDMGARSSTSKVTISQASS